MFKSINYPLLFILSLLLATSCSTPSSIKVLSSPADADVSVVDSNGIEISLGKTPLTSSETEIYRTNNHYSQLKIKKSGYTNENIVLMKSTNGSETTINVQLKKDENVQNIGEQTITQEKIASSIARANAFIQSKQYSEAEAVMLSFIEQYPSVSVGYDYLGNINYLLKRYAKALKYYNKAMSLNPQSSERKIIMERLQNLVRTQSGDAQ